MIVGFWCISVHKLQHQFLKEMQIVIAMESSRRLARSMAVLMVVMVMVLCVEGALIKVGSSRGWIPNYNYTDWSSEQHIYVGDWLYFVFDKRYYNVLEVNQTSYENCNDQGFIKNITRGGRDVVQLTEARPYYYLSSGGYCWNGMKVAINVEEIPPTPAPAPGKSGSPSLTSKQLAIPIALSAALTWLIFWKE